MSWLSRLNPRGPASRAGRSAAPSSPCTADPETCLMVFENHWRQVSWVLERHEPSSSSDDLTAVRNHTDQMLCLLAEERPVESLEGGAGVPPMGPILEMVVTENILESLVQWHLRRGLDPDSQGALLKLFEMLIGQSQQPLLQHTAVLHPLLRLLGACADPELGCPSALENSLVLLLNQVCVSMARQPVVLEMLFRAAPAQQGSTNLLIFSLLVPFIHRDGAIGQQARDALLLVMAASASNEAVARYIAENSYFCPVLATGLSALYSSLPRKIEVRGDDWHALRREDWMVVSALVLFMNSLEFCNAVVQVAHPLVRSQLLDYLHNGFLVPVMGPALHKSSVDEMIASTAYLDLFLRSVSETSLLKTFLRFILLHRHDNDTILDTLLTRISSNSRLCMVSLSLFRTLLSLNCEDVMLQLVLRYLLPCTHVMLSQRRAIRETDMYGKSADKFLSLIPECCRQNTAPPAERDDDNAFWGKVLNSPSTESPAPPRPSTPSRLAFFMRQQSSGGGSGAGGGPSTPTGMEPLQSSSSSSHPMSPDSPMHQQQAHTECLDWDSGYLEYLRDARRGIEVCSWACRDWSAPYDGENPSPNTVPSPPPPPTSNPSMAMFPEHFSFHQGGSSNTPPGQQRSAIVAAARSEWSSSERDSGEWDVTIGKNNCISLTPRSKKRSLQREELLPKPVPHLVPSSSSSTASTLSTSHAASSPAPHVPASAITVSYQAMYNGTMGQMDGCSDSRDRGLEVKKVKRDLGEQQYLDENANQNGSLVTCPSQSCTPLPQSIFSNSEMSDAKSLCPNQSSMTQRAPDTKLQTSDTSNPHSASSDLPEANQTPQSVESLIQELLEQVPGEPQLPGDSNGQGISIEAFTQELRELEDRVKERSRAACQQEEAAREPQSAERQEEEQQLSSALEAKLTGDAKGEGSAVGLCSPARPLNQPAISAVHRSIHGGSVCQAGEHAPKLAIRQHPAHRNRGPAGMLSSATPTLLPAQHQHGLPTQRQVPDPVKSRKPSLGDLILRHTNSPTRARHAAQLALAHVRDGGQSLHSALFRGGSVAGASSLEKQAEALRVKNAVYCAVIFCEFLKELAALAQEHAVTLPFPHSQGAEE
ncbi:FTS and Hook-interacting protein -like protein [Collichthys lucidus]|uniref:FHF complex subunit HOOK-interacting protein 1B n=1 Tax=Collichthys lucidus TaxID=240159 RepID=A0A4U5U127_COLLU|nr:FTS and Hook-interacting protein -like protein [Collichthys lucidus]